MGHRGRLALGFAWVLLFLFYCEASCDDIGSQSVCSLTSICYSVAMVDNRIFLLQIIFHNHHPNSSQASLNRKGRQDQNQRIDDAP